MDAPEVVVCIDTDTEPKKLPPLGVIVGVVTVGRLTVRLKEVVLVIPPPVAVIVIVDVPAGVALLVLMVKVVEQAGLHEADENDPVAPEGRPETEKETA
jgi:hypothetical protein